MTRWRVALLIAIATLVPALTVAVVLSDLPAAARDALLRALGDGWIVLAIGLVALVTGIGLVAWGTWRSEQRADRRQAAAIDVITTSNPAHRLAGATAVERAVNQLAEAHATTESRLADRLAVASADLIEERDTLFAILRDLDVPVGVVGTDGRLVLINPAARAAITSRTRLVAGRSVLGIFDADDLRPLLARALRGERPRAVVGGTPIRLARLSAGGAPLVLFIGEPGSQPSGPELGLSADLAATRRPAPPRAEWRDAALDELAFTVVDCETTGLHAAAGDRLLSVGAVRVSGGKVRADDTFDALVNPGRPIPESSIQFHGITDEQVAEAASGSTVLGQFAEYAEESVLVGHHLAFDLGFLGPVADEAGVGLEPLTLDTMLLSAVLDPDPEARHGLDAVCARFGVQVVGRHTALGDALATAEVLVKMLPLLAGRGITTLAEAQAACDRTELATRIASSA